MEWGGHPNTSIFNSYFFHLLFEAPFKWNMLQPSSMFVTGKFWQKNLFHPFLRHPVAIRIQYLFPDCIWYGQEYSNGDVVIVSIITYFVWEGTRSLSAMPQSQQYPKWPLGGPTFDSREKAFLILDEPIAPHPQTLRVNRFSLMHFELYFGTSSCNSGSWLGMTLLILSYVLAPRGGGDPKTPS